MSNNDRIAEVQAILQNVCTSTAQARQFAESIVAALGAGAPKPTDDAVRAALNFLSDCFGSGTADAEAVFQLRLIDKAVFPHGHKFPSALAAYPALTAEVEGLRAKVAELEPLLQACVDYWPSALNDDLQQRTFEAARNYIDAPEAINRFVENPPDDPLSRCGLTEGCGARAECLMRGVCAYTGAALRGPWTKPVAETLSAPPVWTAAKEALFLRLADIVQGHSRRDDTWAELGSLIKAAFASVPGITGPGGGNG